MLHKDAAFDALLGHCRQAHQDGLLPKRVLEKTLPRLQGDFESWLRRPDEIGALELIDTLAAAFDASSEAPGDLYGSMTEPNPGRVVGEKRLSLSPSSPSEMAQIEAAFGALWLAALLFRGSKARHELKRELLLGALERFFPEWIDRGPHQG